MKAACCVSDTVMLLKLVSAGAGVSMVSAAVAKETVERGSVIQFELDSQPVTRKLYMVYRKNGAPCDLARDFMTLVREKSAGKSL